MGERAAVPRPHRIVLLLYHTPYAAVKGAPADLALQVSAVAWCVIGCGALVMALCWQIEQALLDIGPDEGGSDRPTSISGHL